MRFRSYITLALAVTALAPFLAMSWLQSNDLSRSVARADVAQTESAERIAALLRERLRSVREIAVLSERLLVPKLSDPQGTAAREAILADTVASFPILNNLHVDRIDFEGNVIVAGFHPPYTPDNERALGQNHTDRWHAWLARETNERGVRFSPVIMSSQRSPVPLLTFAIVSEDRRAVISGSLELPALFADLAENAELKGARFVVLDPNRQIIYPQGDQSHIRAWPHDEEPAYKVTLNDTLNFATEAKLDASNEHFPDWTVIVVKPQSVRVAELTSLQVRTAMFGIFVILFTIAAGVITARPIRNAMGKLERDLKGGAPDATIQGGPEEFLEYQNAYREVRAKLEERSVKLEDLNKNLETLVERRSRELTAEELLFRQVFNEIEDAILLVDTEWTLREMNRTAEVSLTSDQRTAFLERCREYAQSDGVDRSGIDVPPASDHSTFEREDSVHGNTLVIHGDSEVDDRSYECRIFPFTARRSDLTDGFCVLIRDITKRERLEQMKENLIGIVAHELKTPITTCRLQLEAYERKNGSSDATRAMGEDLNHLKRLVDDWLSVVKIDAGTYSVTPDFVTLTPLVSRAKRFVATRYDFHLTVSIAEDAECLYADATALVEVFVNLFTNACRYAKSGTVPQIHFEAFREGGEAIIEVSDEGIGIAPEERERIFGRFYRVMNDHGDSQTRKAGGTGLGLVICRAVCRAHGGDICADEKEGHTVFRIHLPQPAFTEDSPDEGFEPDEASSVARSPRTPSQKEIS